MNTLISSRMILRETLFALEGTFGAALAVNRTYSDEFLNKPVKQGDTIPIRLPIYMTVNEGRDYKAQDIEERTVDFKVDHQDHVDFQFYSSDLALTIEEFKTRYTNRAAAAMGAKINARICDCYTKFAHAVGTAGVMPTDLDTYLFGAVKLQDIGVPWDKDVTCVLSPMAQAKIVNGLKGLENPKEAIGDQYLTGRMRRAGGLNWVYDESVKAHTVGPLGYAAASALVDTAGQSGASIATKGWTAAAANRLKDGDVITFAGVYELHPQTKRSTGSLMQFSVQGDVDSLADGTAAVPISPPLEPSGPYQNVTGSPADAAVIAVAGAANTVTPQALIIHKDAILLASVDLPTAGGLDMSTRVQSKKLGISLRLHRWYDGDHDLWKTRIDCLYGLKVPRPDLGARVYC
jgi:hypothetical protein